MRQPMKTERPFLTAEWRDLVMLNYLVDPDVLGPYLPKGTELDSFEGHRFVSLVAFRFLNTRMYGRIAIPWHSNFDEVNLRFYVRREEQGEVRRGVVFIAEIVPRRAVAVLARLAYNENYFCCPMTRTITRASDIGELRYGWSVGKSTYAITARTARAPALPLASSAEQFITEHYWGYASQRDGSTVEYRVEHEQWRVWNATTANFSGDAGTLYGSQFKNTLSEKPHSAFVADGSHVKVFQGRKLPL